MGKRTGNPRGRPRGAQNKRTEARAKALEATVEKVAAALGAEVFDGDAHALLMLTYKDKGLPLDTRLDAAKAAISFEKPKLASIEQKLDAEIRQRVVSDKPMSDDEWSERYGDRLASAGGAAESPH